MRLLKTISSWNKKIPKVIRFIIGLILLNIPPITYLIGVNAEIAPIYTAIIFLLINIAALIAYFKVKEVEIESPLGKYKFKR